jgi:spermidine/putrescine transport system permease protein
MSNKLFRRIAISLVFTWLIVLALLPVLMVFVASFLKQGTASLFVWHFTWSNYQQLGHFIFLHIFLRSLWVALLTTVICLVLGYPFAYILVQLPKRLRLLGLFLVIVPFWTSSLIRTYAIMTIVKTHGLLNQFLLWTGLIHQPLHILYTQVASQIGLAYSLLPFMVLPLYAALEKFDWRLVDAAMDLGANRWKAFWKVVVPVSMPGVWAGSLLVLLPAMTLFYIPEMLGGARSLLLGNLIKNEFLAGQNWPLGSAISMALILLMGVLIVLYWKLNKSKDKQQVLS